MLVTIASLFFSHSLFLETDSSGQRVQTCYGDGVIVSRIAPGNNTGLRYKVKLGYGTSYLRPSAIVHTLPATDPQQRMVRRNGVMEKASLLEESEDDVDRRCQLMFGTEKVYSLIRIYSYLAFVLSNTKSFLNSEEGQQKETQTTNGIGSTFEKNDTNGKASIASHDYPGVISALKKLIAGEIDVQAYESFCRKTTKEKVYQLIALPRLIERCAEALVKVAKEDKALALYDLAQLKIMVRDCSSKAQFAVCLCILYISHSSLVVCLQDPERLRVLSHSETTDASYRIQFDPAEEVEYFCYLAPGDQVLLAPEADEEMETVEEEGDADAAMDKDGDVEMVDGEMDAAGRDAKRQKVDHDEADI